MFNETIGNTQIINEPPGIEGMQIERSWQWQRYHEYYLVCKVNQKLITMCFDEIKKLKEQKEYYQDHYERAEEWIQNNHGHSTFARY
jgi:hypothetical protein